MIELPNHICVCNDWYAEEALMQSNGPIDYSHAASEYSGVQVFNMADMEQSIPKRQNPKRKKRAKNINH